MQNKKEIIIKSKMEAVYIVLKVIFFLFIIYISIAFFRLIWLMFQESNMFQAEFFQLRTEEIIGFISVAEQYGISLRNIIPAYFIENSKKIYILSNLLELGGTLILGYILWEIVRMFRTIVMTGRPYSSDIIIRLRRMAIGIAILGVYKKAAVPAILWMVNIAKQDIQLLDPFTLIIAGIIFCLSYIFEYGMELQTESDETL